MPRRNTIIFWCAILSGLGGGTGILVWLGIKPQDLKVNALPSIGSPWAFAIAFTLILVSVGMAAYGLFQVRLTHSAVVIHSAHYGTGSAADWNVTGILRRHHREGMVVRVENDFFGRDPVPHKPKQLKVVYSLGNRQPVEVIRPEHARMVLPEDDYLLALTQKLSNDLRTVEAERDAFRLRAIASDVKFGDALQGIDPATDPLASWWHIPITASAKLEDCMVDVEIGHHGFEMLWSVGYGEMPRRIIDLLPQRAVKVAIALRCERGRWGLCPRPWAALVTDANVMGHRKYNPANWLPEGKIALKVKLSVGGQQYAVENYQIFVPPLTDGTNNGHFYVRHYDGL